MQKKERMNTINLNLAHALAKVTLNWMDCRESIAKLCMPEWKKKGDWMAAHMIDNYIMVDTPITLRIYDLDKFNQAILFRALEQWGDCRNEEIEY